MGLRPGRVRFCKARGRNNMKKITRKGFLKIAAATAMSGVKHALGEL